MPQIHLPKVRRGEEQPQSKLKTNQVKEILISPEAPEILAKKFKVSRSLIVNIKAGRRWKHL